MWVFFVKIISIPDEELFSETYVGCTDHTLSKLYDVTVGFSSPPSLIFWGSVLLDLRSPKGGCCSISDDLSCSFTRYWEVLITYFRDKWHANKGHLLTRHIVPSHFKTCTSSQLVRQIFFPNSSLLSWFSGLWIWTNMFNYTSGKKKQCIFKIAV